jgi:phage terminase small subunit
VPQPKDPDMTQEVSKDKKKLTAKEKLFCDNYLVHLNASKAVRESGYESKNPHELGYKLLRKGHIADYISERLKEQTDKLDIQQERILRELKSVAFAKITHFMSVEHGQVRMLDTDGINEEYIGAVASYTETTINGGGNISIKLHDKLKALDMLAKYAKLFKEEDDGDSGKTSDLERLRKTLTGGVLNTLQALRGGKQS